MNVDRHIIQDYKARIPKGQASIRVVPDTLPSYLTYQWDLVAHKLQRDLYQKLKRAIRELDLSSKFIG